jgi:3-hydroxybutyryl-CoA dehydrogenase
VDVDAIRRVAVVGAGQMGRGIALCFALGGCQVHLCTRTEEGLRRAVKDMLADLLRLAHFGLVSPEGSTSVWSRVHLTTRLPEAAGAADIVVEAAPEDLGLKREVFAELDRLCPRHAVLASTTSTIMPSQLAGATRRPEQVVVTHFTYPAEVVPLVEVVRGAVTSDDTVAAVCALLRRVGKRPALVRKEVPGFIANRLQAALLREALALVERGVASPQDIDAVLKDGQPRRWAAAGLFEMLEAVAGWDLALAAAFHLFPDLDQSSEMSAFPCVLEKVRRGQLGAKTGKGFYEWTPESAEAARRRIASVLMIEKWQRTPERDGEPGDGASPQEEAPPARERSAG